MNFLVAIVTGVVCSAVGTLVFNLPGVASAVIGVIGYTGGRIAGMVEKKVNNLTAAQLPLAELNFA